MSILRFLLTLEANSWDEPGAAEVRDGPMVSLAKMILIIETWRFLMISLKILVRTFFLIFIKTNFQILDQIIREPGQEFRVQNVPHDWHECCGYEVLWHDGWWNCATFEFDLFASTKEGGVQEFEKKYALDIIKYITQKVGIKAVCRDKLNVCPVCL